VHNYLKVEGSDSLVRDVSTHAIINTNSVEYDNYLLRKRNIESQQEELTRNTNDINTIKQELSEIKELLLLSLKLKDTNGGN
jgi:CRISPR/Cas system-associated protein Cas7 (RAMP superfamily)